MDNQKPNWGKTIGAFFLCGCLAVGSCIVTSAVIASGMGFSGYSRGGLMATVTGIACAAYYRSTGKLAGPAIAALVIGAVLGILAVQLSLMLAGQR